MRGDATLQARLLLRQTGIAAAGITLGGFAALVGAYRPWYAVTAELTMLDEDQTRSVAELAGWTAHPWGWLIPALGVLAIGLGIATAIDRPPARTRPLLFGTAGVLALCALAGSWRRPDVDRFDIAGSRLRELVDLADRLPTGVELEFDVAVAHGVWLTLLAAGVVIAGALAARELP